MFAIVMCLVVLMLEDLFKEADKSTNIYTCISIVVYNS